MTRFPSSPRLFLFRPASALFFCFLFSHLAAQVPVLEDVKIAFVSYRSGSAEIYLMNSDGSGVEQLTDSPEDNRFPVQLDFRTLGFTRIDSQQNVTEHQIDIYTREEQLQVLDPVVPGAEWEATDSSGRYTAYFKRIQRVNELFIYDHLEKYERQVTRNLREGILAHSVNHTWSANGRFIAFMSGPDWYNQFIRVYDLETDSIRVVTERGYMNSGLLWLTDNATLIANLKVRDETLYDLYQVEVASGAVRQITDGINLHPNISPDGQWIVFESQRHGSDGEVYVMRPDGSQQTRLTDNPNYNGRCIWFRLK